MNDLTRQQTLGVFTLVLAFMEQMCWEPAREAKRKWIPESRESLDFKAREKNYGKTRVAMNKAASYLAKSELNIGLDQKQVAMAFSTIKNWKFYFVENMADKKNIQLEEECKKRIAIGRRAGKALACEHNDKHLLGRKGAIALADNIFRMVYDAEIRAYQETGLSRFYARDPGPVEFGENMSDPEYLPRQFAEVPTGEFYTSKDDEHTSNWSMGDFSELTIGDDEHVETEFGNQLIIDYSTRNEKYGDLRRAIMKAKDQDEREKIVLKGENMAKLDIIADWQARSLKYWSFQVASYRIAEYRGKLNPVATE